MKQYQVVVVYRCSAERNGEVIYHDRTKSQPAIMELIINRYAKDGWDIKMMTYCSDNYGMYIVFEK